MYSSPLRYPGGKGRLAPFMEYMIKRTGHEGGTYVEPFAGGAGIAIELLEKGIVSEIVINDYDKAIYSFWRAILTETDRFIAEVRHIPLTIDEWKKQKTILTNKSHRYSYELGFAAFYMNRTNRSGILKGGVIGGYEQTGRWKMDARFNRESLIERISSIADLRNQIHVYNKDISSFIDIYLDKYSDNSLVYFDPPYYEKGSQLYMNFFKSKDHVRIERSISMNVRSDWIITYDDCEEIRRLYSGYSPMRYDLDYSASRRRKASEIIVFKDKGMIPDNEELMKEGININLRSA